MIARNEASGKLSFIFTRLSGAKSSKKSALKEDCVWLEEIDSDEALDKGSSLLEGDELTEFDDMGALENEDDDSLWLCCELVSERDEFGALEEEKTEVSD